MKSNKIRNLVSLWLFSWHFNTISLNQQIVGVGTLNNFYIYKVEKVQELMRQSKCKCYVIRLDLQGKYERRKMPTVIFQNVCAKG